MKRRRWLVVALAVAAVLVVAENLIFFSGSMSPPPAPGADVDEELDEPEETAETQAAPLASVSYASILDYLEGVAVEEARSPFLTRREAELLQRSGEATGGGLPVLSGTLWSAERRVAWLDGFPYSEGDPVGVHRVERIEPGAILLQSRRGSLRLEVRPEPTPEPAGAPDGEPQEASL